MLHRIYKLMSRAYSPFRDNGWAELYEAAQTIRPP
jgi:hypothetical protein